MKLTRQFTISLIQRTARHRRLLLTGLVVALVAWPIIERPASIARAKLAFAPQSFTFLAPGFTQQIIGVSTSFFGGVAFAPDGDPLVDFCGYSGSPLHRFDLGGATTTVNGTALYPSSLMSSNAGCGITTHPDGNLYSNTGLGVVRLNANTGAQIGSAFGPPGNALGITPDPQTGNLVYVGSDGTIRFVNSAFTTSGVFSTVTTGNFVDGIYFDPTGNFLFLANRIPSFRLTILNRAGALVRHVPMTSEPDGIAFHAIAPKFVITNNTDGTITRFDFPGDDFTQAPSQSLFASGGFRGDLSQVGPDGCLYLTQDGTRYNDGTVTGENSLVRICPNFAPPVCPGNITLPNASAGMAYNQAVSAAPGGPYMLLTGNLPSGLTLNSMTGVISGTATGVGTYNFTINANSIGGCSGSRAYTLTVVCPTIGFNPASLPNVAVGAAYNQSLNATPAGGNYFFVVASGALPAGLSLNGATGVISGTPTASGTFNLTITATGFGSCSASKPYSITVTGGGCGALMLPTISGGTVGQVYGQSVDASPAGAYSYTVTSGALPPGLALYPGLLFGFPTAVGSYNFTITASGGGCTVSRPYTVVINN